MTLTREKIKDDLTALAKLLDLGGALEREMKREDSLFEVFVGPGQLIEPGAASVHLPTRILVSKDKP